MKNEHLVKCPNGHTMRITDSQLNGKDRIVCVGNHGYCSFSGYIDDVDVIMKDITTRFLRNGDSDGS